jgi:hypothetical protein
LKKNNSYRGTGDENSAKPGINDKRCLIEVRPAKLQPVVVTAHADTVEKAFHDAPRKNQENIEHHIR